MIKSIPAFIIAVFFFVIGVVMIIKRVKQQKYNTESTYATVIDYIQKVSHDADTGDHYSYFPVVQYRIDGKTYQNKTDIGYGKKKFPIGDEIEIKFNPNNPEEFHLANSPISWILPIIVTIMGLGVMILMIGK